MIQRPSDKRITNADIYYMLGQLAAEQKSTLELLKEHMEEDRRRWDAIHKKTDTLDTKITYWSGAAAVLGVVIVGIIHKVLGL